MAITADVKIELSRVVVTPVSARKAEVATVLRFAGGLHIVGGRVIVEAELDTQAVAQRIGKDIVELYGHRVDMQVLPALGNGEGTRYTVRAVAGGDSLARQTGLLDPRGRPVRGLPAQIVSGSVSDAAAAWRGAFLAHGSLTEPGHYTSLEITCPGPEAALALVGAARRLGIVAKARETRGADRVVIRESDAITAMLTRFGALSTALVWDERRRRRDIRSVADRPTHFDDANQRRSTRAAAAASARIRRALEILADNIPDHLAEAGNLRIQHSEASLEQLSQLTDPPMTKDAIAGRIRRLLTMADKRAHEQGIPDTESVFATDTVS